MSKKWSFSLSDIHSSQWFKGLRARPNLELAIAIIGILAIIFLLVLLLVPLPSGKPPMTLSKSVTIGSEEFLPALSALTHAPIRRGSEVSIYNNGDEFIPALVDSIQRAKTTINFTNFIWWDGIFSDTIFEALTAAASRGVEVRVLVDYQGAKLPDEKVAALESAGGRVEIFRGLSLGSMNRFNKRNHRRAIIFDGREGYLGGIAIADDWLGDGRTPESWRDYMFRVQGDMALSLQDAFADIWYEKTGEVLVGENFFPAAVDAGNMPYVHLVTSPTEYAMPVKDIYMLSIKAAQKTLYIANPYFLPDGEMRDALIEAAARGVDVRIILPASSLSPVHSASKTNYGVLLGGGVRIFEYPGLFHQKALIADSTWSIIGSANLDYRSRAINEENIMGIQDVKLAGELEALYREDMDFAQEVTEGEWKKKAWLSYIPSHLSRLFSKQY